MRGGTGMGGGGGLAMSGVCIDAGMAYTGAMGVWRWLGAASCSPCMWDAMGVSAERPVSPTAGTVAAAVTRSIPCEKGA